jgi:hypothetical protein
MTLNPMANISLEKKELGAIKTEENHIPTAQKIEISSEDFLWYIRTINGISHKGSITPAQNPIVFI